MRPCGRETYDGRETAITLKDSLGRRTACPYAAPGKEARSCRKVLLRRKVAVAGTESQKRAGMISRRHGKFACTRAPTLVETETLRRLLAGRSTDFDSS